jgi:hypothetical protein
VKLPLIIFPALFLALYLYNIALLPRLLSSSLAKLAISCSLSSASLSILVFLGSGVIFNSLGGLISLRIIGLGVESLLLKRYFGDVKTKIKPLRAYKQIERIVVNKKVRV